MLNNLSPWLLVAGCFAFLATVSGGTRHLVRRAKVSTEQSDYADGIVGPLGAIFAFLVAFAITMSWSAINTGQTAVDLQASSAQQVAWSTKAIRDKAGATEVVDNLRAYLEAVVAEDVSSFVRGKSSNLPSTARYDQLQDSIHAVAYRDGTSIPEANGMVSAAQAMTGARGSLQAVALRSVPVFLLCLIAIAATALSVVMGFVASTVERPGLMYLWSFVAGLAVAVVLTLSSPFGAGVGVELAPLAEVAKSLTN
jgi:hypothetical protein